MGEHIFVFRKMNSQTKGTKINNPFRRMVTSQDYGEEVIDMDNLDGDNQGDYNYENDEAN